MNNPSYAAMAARPISTPSPTRNTIIPESPPPASDTPHPANSPDLGEPQGARSMDDGSPSDSGYEEEAAPGRDFEMGTAIHRTSLEYRGRPYVLIQTAPNTLFVAYLGKDDVRPFFFGTPTRFFPSTQSESPNWAKKWPEIVTICRATEPSPITPEDVKGGLIESHELPKLAGIVAWHASDGTGKVSFPELDAYNLSRTKKGITFRTHELACAPPFPGRPSNRSRSKSPSSSRMCSCTTSS